MPQGTMPIFNKKAMEKLRNPDDLGKYVRVPNPSIILIIAAIAALLVGSMSWELFGTSDTSLAVNSAKIGDKVVCFLDAESVAVVSVGDDVNVDGNQGTVEVISDIPYSLSEAKAMLDNDYLTSSVMTGDWAYLIELKGDFGQLPNEVPLPTLISVDRVAPINRILGN
jgi:hypothetical protein